MLLKVYRTAINIFRENTVSTGFLRARTINTNPRPGFLRENTVSMGFLTASEILSRALSRKNAGFCNSVSLENPHEGFLLTPSDSV